MWMSLIKRSLSKVQTLVGYFLIFHNFSNEFWCKKAMLYFFHLVYQKDYRPIDRRIDKASYRDGRMLTLDDTRCSLVHSESVNIVISSSLAKALK